MLHNNQYQTNLKQNCQTKGKVIPTSKLVTSLHTIVICKPFRHIMSAHWNIAEIYPVTDRYQTCEISGAVSNWEQVMVWGHQWGKETCKAKGKCSYLIFVLLQIQKSCHHSVTDLNTPDYTITTSVVWTPHLSAPFVVFSLSHI